MPLEPGTRLGPYEILAPLGAGGMGEVYRARDPRLDREVAVKVLPDRLSRNKQALANFEREAKAVAALSHPNILAIFDFGAAGGISYAVTELLEGETLGQRLARSPLPWRKAVEIGAAVAEGLAAAHAKGIIHRDLKPDNVFLTSDGRVKILDFGIAQWKPPAAKSPEPQAETVDSLAARQSSPSGTSGYMSPEQVLGLEAAPASDIFSLGCVLYEVLTGQRAFLRATAAQTMAAILEAQPAELTGPGGEIPVELKQLIAHCLQKDPQKRFHSAHDLGLALRAVAGTAPAAGMFSGLNSRRVFLAAAGIVAAVVLYWGFAQRDRGQGIDSIAVLPFENSSADPNMEYLSDGIAEGIINSLTQLPKLRVTARSTAFRHKGRDVDPLKAGRDLKVRAVLTGKVVQRGDTLEVQADLLSVGNGAQLWGQRYNRKFSDIFAVQEEIAKEISEKLSLKLSGEEQRKLAKRVTDNPEAYRLYLQGRYHWDKRTAEGLKKAIEYFEQAIGKDAGFALAYAGLADGYALVSTYGTQAPRESFPKAEAAAKKALEIDEALAEAHASLAFIRWQFNWDWQGGEREFRRAIELNPGYGTARHWYALYLVSLGRFEEGIREIHRAQEVDPLSLIIATSVGGVYFRARQYDRAIEQYRRVLDMDPNFPRARMELGWAYEQKEILREAVQELEKARALSGGSPLMTAALGRGYAVAGRKAEAQKIIAELTDLSKQRYIPADQIAVIYAGLGDKDRALEWLTRAYEDRSGELVWLRIIPWCDNLRSESRFQDLQRRIFPP